MIRTPLLLLVAFLAFWLTAPADADELALLHHESFADGKVDGPVGKAGSIRTLNASRILDFDRGTFAYFTHVDKPYVISEWNRLAGGNGIRAGGYWGMAMDFSLRREDLIFNLYDVGRYARPMHLESPFDRWQVGEWHHLAAVWDRNEGIKVYEDGKLVVSNWGEHHWDWSLLPDKFFARGTIDELYLFATPLTDAQIAQLARGESPTGSPMPLVQDDVRRQRDLARMGWTGDSLAALPSVTAGSALTIAFARITEIIDAKRPDNHPFDGIGVTTWPNEMYGASTRGEHMDITFEDGASYDHMRVFYHRPYEGALTVDGQDTPMTAPNAAIAHTKLSNLKTAKNAVISREKYGQLGEIDFYTATHTPRKVGQATTFHFAKTDDLPEGMTGDTLIGETPYRYRQFAQATVDAGNAWTVNAPAFGGFQAVSDPLNEANAYDGAAITLVAEGITQPTPVRVRIKEPIYGLRDWLVGDFILEPKGNGKQTWTVHLTGRPVINMPQYEKQRYWKDGLYHDEFDTIPGEPIGVSIVAANPVTWHMGKGGCAIALTITDMQKALPAATVDQEHYMREAYSDLMEGHAYRDPRIVTPTMWLAMFAPESVKMRQMFGRMDRPRWFKGIEENVKPLVRPDTPNNTGAPDWAFWQMQAMNEHLRLIHSHIDDQQVRTGEFGGVWNDDTIHTENWYGYMLAMDDGHKIRNAMRKFWDGNWNHLHEGVGQYTQDVCHFYEEGMGSQAMRMLIDYGDPTTHNRAMKSASHYDQWFNVDSEGKYSWNSEYVSYFGSWLERDFGIDVRQGGHKWDMLVPAGYMVWFNRHPKVGKIYQGLSHNERGASFHGYAMAVLDDIEAAKKAWLEDATKPNRRGYGAHLFAIDAGGMTDAIREGNPQEYAEAKPIRHYWGAHDTNTHYFQWRVTGDERYLVDSYKRVCEWFYSHDWLNTQAMPSMDRNPLPRYSLIRARLGAIVAQRGSSGLLWPLHAFSFESGANDVASLVTENTDDGFTTKLYAFTDKPHAMSLRSWRPKPGTYTVTVSQDGKNLSEQTVELTRGSPFDVTIPAKTLVTLAVKAVSNHELDYTLPDLAISEETCPMVYKEHQVVRVYNLGRTPVENVLVRARDLHSGEIIVNGEKRIARIEAPNDFEPRYGSVEFKNFNANVLGGIIIEVDPDNEIEELIPFNNRVILRY